VSWTEETFVAGDGYVARYRLYPPKTARRGLIVALHGIQSHAGWYEYSSECLAQSGYEVRFLDRRGSGRNTENRGDAPSFRRLLDDVAEFVRQSRRGDESTSLLGVSWGGKAVAGVLHRHPGLVDRVALLCPGFCPKIHPPLVQRLRIGLARLLMPRRRFPIPLNDPELFTATPHWLQFLRCDPLALHEATARLLFESVRLDLYLRRVASSIRVPVLLMLAGRDRIIDNDRTRQFVSRFQGPVTILEYPEAQHTLEFEPDPSRFVQDLLAWIETNSSRRATVLPSS
jgi:alpha-beta hydrolase superfamily lysophospholipase